MSANCMGVGHADDPLRGGGVLPRKQSAPTATMRELLGGGWSNADMDEIAARVEAVLALALESRRKAMAGDGYGLIHAHEVLMLLDGEQP